MLMFTPSLLWLMSTRTWTVIPLVVGRHMESGSNSEVAIAKFHSGGQEMSLMSRVFKSHFDGGVEVVKILEEFL